MPFLETKPEEISERYQVNLPFIVYETFADQETAIINLKTGNYYSLNISGAEIWEQISKNIDVNVLVENLLIQQDGEPELIRRSIQDFVENLKNEELIIEFKGTPETDTTVKTPIEGNTKIPFSIPIIEGYTDMQELLLLDPIHDVDETGFPNAKPR